MSSWLPSLNCSLFHLFYENFYDRTSLAFLDKSWPIFKNFHHCKDYSICNKSHAILLHHTLGTLLHYVRKLKKSNLLKIWKRIQTKCLIFTCTHFNGSLLLTNYLLIYYFNLWFLLNILWNIKLFNVAGLSFDSNTARWACDVWVLE